MDPRRLFPPNDPWRFLLPALGVLILLGVVALVATRDDDDGERVTAGDDRSTTTVQETSTTTTPSTTVVASTVATTATTARPAPATVATAPPPSTTTTAAGPARTWSISPTSGPPNSRFDASGSGCLGQDAGVSLTMYDPNGQAYNGDGAAAMPDGTWHLSSSIGAVPPGRYTIKAACQGSSPFEYPQAMTFTVT